MDFTKRAVKRLAGELDGDEAVRHGIYAMPPGSIARGIGDRPNVRGAVSAAREKKRQLEDSSESLASQIPPQAVFLTLTDRRMLVHTVTKSGKPQDLLCEYGPDDIDGVDAKKGKMGGGEVLIRFADESDVHMAVRSGQDVERFESTWSQIGGAS